MWPAAIICLNTHGAWAGAEFSARTGKMLYQPLDNCRLPSLKGGGRSGATFNNINKIHINQTITVMARYLSAYWPRRPRGLAVSGSVSLTVLSSFGTDAKYTFRCRWAPNPRGSSRAGKSGWQALKVSTSLGRRECRTRAREHGYAHAQSSTSLAALFAGGGIGGGSHEIGRA